MVTCSSPSASASRRRPLSDLAIAAAERRARAAGRPASAPSACSCRRGGPVVLARLEALAPRSRCASARRGYGRPGYTRSSGRSPRARCRSPRRNLTRLTIEGGRRSLRDGLGAHARGREPRSPRRPRSAGARSPARSSGRSRTPPCWRRPSPTAFHAVDGGRHPLERRVPAGAERAERRTPPARSSRRWLPRAPPLRLHWPEETDEHRHRILDNERTTGPGRRMLARTARRSSVRDARRGRTSSPSMHRTLDHTARRPRVLGCTPGRSIDEPVSAVHVSAGGGTT